MARRGGICLTLVVLALHGCGTSERSVEWIGEVDDKLLSRITDDINAAQRDNILLLHASITSMGGTVWDGLAIASRVRGASDGGLTVEITARGYCASACTFILAAGTPGHRLAAPDAFILVHAPWSDGPFGIHQCVTRPDVLATLEDKHAALVLDSVVKAYIRYTGASTSDVEAWLKCDTEHSGFGGEAVELHLADRVAAQ